MRVLFTLTFVLLLTTFISAQAWTNPARISAAADATINDANVFWDTNNNVIHVVWITGAAQSEVVNYARSTNQGSTWTAAAGTFRVGAVPAGNLRGPRVIVDPTNSNNVQIWWQEDTTAGAADDLTYARVISANAGVTWGAAANVLVDYSTRADAGADPIAEAAGRFFDVAYDPAGVVHIVYTYDTNAGAGVTEGMGHSSSADGFVAINNIVLVAGLGISTTTTTSPSLVLDPTDLAAPYTFYTSFSGFSGGNAQAAWARTVDGGTNWDATAGLPAQAELVAGNAFPQIETKGIITATSAVSTFRVYWADTSVGGDNDIYVSVFTGATTPGAATAVTANAIADTTPAAAAFGTALTTAFDQAVGGADTEIILNHETDTAVTLTANAAADDDPSLSYGPQPAGVGTNMVIAVYSGDGTGGRNAMFSIFVPATPVTSQTTSTSTTCNAAGQCGSGSYCDGSIGLCQPCPTSGAVGIVECANQATATPTATPTALATVVPTATPTPPGTIITIGSGSTLLHPQIGIPIDILFPEIHTQICCDITVIGVDPSAGIGIIGIVGQNGIGIVQGRLVIPIGKQIAIPVQAVQVQPVQPVVVQPGQPGQLGQNGIINVQVAANGDLSISGSRINANEGQCGSGNYYDSSAGYCQPCTTSGAVSRAGCGATPTPGITPSPTVSSGESITIGAPDNAALNQQVDVSIKTSGGQAVSGATVQISYPSGKVQTLSTDTTGLAQFTPNELGKITLKARKGGSIAQKDLNITPHRVAAVALIPGILAFNVDTQTAGFVIILVAFIAALVAWFEGKGRLEAGDQYILPGALFVIPVIATVLGAAELVSSIIIPLTIIVLVLYWFVLNQKKAKHKR